MVDTVSLIPVAICIVSSLILFPFLDTGIVDMTGDKFATTLAELVAKFVAGVVDTGSNFAADVVALVANLPPVLLTPVVHLDLRISPRIFRKNLKWP
jgi:hypothetical protein